MKRLVALILSSILVFFAVSVAIPVGTVHAAEIARYTVLVLEVSSSATFSSGGVQIYEADSAVEYVRTAAHSFLSDMLYANGNNYVALITYTSSAVVVSDFTNDFEMLTDYVDNIKESDSFGRNIADGLNEANELLEQISDAAATRNVVLITTGMTNTGEYSATGEYNSNTTGSSWYNTNTGIYLYQYANVAYMAAEAVKNNATLYTLGLFQTMAEMPEKGKDIADFFKRTAEDLASEACFYDASNPAELEFAFGDIAGDIMAQEGLFKYAGFIDKNKDSVGEYFYSNSYFFKRASLQNPSLATMSLCLELSSWSSHDKKDWYDPDKPKSMDDKLVNVKTLLLGNPEAGEGYEGIGFSHFSANEGWYAPPTNDSVGVCVARKQIYRNERKKTDPYTLIAIVVRGGGYYSEWASNFKIGEDGEHEGFAQASGEVIEFVENYITTLNDDESKNLKLWIVGYSRGGAIANMTAGRIYDNPNMFDGCRVDPEDLFCYTFEAPQGAIKEDMNGPYYSIHNILNANDVVPLVAPTSWGFARYNYGNTCYLPSPYTVGKTFDAKEKAMIEELEKLGFEVASEDGSGFTYKISDTCSVEELKIDLECFWPFGEPLWWTEKSEAPTLVVLKDGVNLLADELIGDRTFYVKHLQYCVSEVLGIVMHYNGLEGGLSSYGNSLIDLEEFKENLLEFFEFDSLLDTLSPMFSLNPFYSFDDRVEDVKLKAMKKLGSIFEAYAEIDGFIDGIGEVITNLVVQVANDVWNNNLNSVNVISKFVHVFVESGFQPHYPEICLAWCRSLDPNYVSGTSGHENSAITRVIKINCPVNVLVYDDNNNLAASIVDDVASQDNVLVAYVNDDGEKVLYLPGDSDYYIEIEATDDGYVNYSVAEYSFVHNQYVRMENYYDIGVSTGDVLRAEVSAAGKEALQSNDISGTDANYELYHNGYQLYSDESFNGEDPIEQNCTVTVTTEGNGGRAFGSGRYTRGGFAEVEAYTYANCEFLGWYDEYETLLSTELSYRFAVRGDVEITAKFSETEICKAQFTARKGGTVTAPNGYYPQGTRLVIVATPNEGYVFVGWKTDAGELIDDKSLETEFIMPERNAKITAMFEPIDGYVKNNDIPLAAIIAFLFIGIVFVGVVILAIAIVRKERSIR